VSGSGLGKRKPGVVAAIGGLVSAARSVLLFSLVAASRCSTPWEVKALLGWRPCGSRVSWRIADTALEDEADTGLPCRGRLQELKGARLVLGHQDRASDWTCSRGWTGG
jgi:hypothetical protein